VTAGQGANGGTTAELARANLLRMRGDTKGAIDQCLHILKTDPEDLDAHLFIADLYTETGDLEQATTWYELALDLAPRDQSIRTKIRELAERRKEQEAVAAAPELELQLPSARPPYALYGGVGGVIVLTILLGAFALSRAKPVERTPLVVTAPSAVASPAPEAAQRLADVPATTVANAATVEDDATLTRQIAGRLPAGVSLVGALQDPRTQQVMMTVAVAAEGAERTTAAEAARAALGAALAAPSVVVRVARQGRLVYVATVDRSRFAETETSVWRETNPTADAWIAHVLQNEWGSAATVVPSAASSSSATSGDGGTTSEPPVTTDPSATP
jgi:tetratricopeptide (TPR) repeat protein